jgi:16S rRNA (guanine527-N7)-methyltransferase
LCFESLNLFGIWNLEFGIWNLNRYFPDLSPAQLKQLEQLGPLYHEWNAKINVISRKDIDNLYERHVLHSMSIARAIEFKSGTTVLDAGTGGGFPGIPLAILFPDVYFHLADSTAKKLSVINAIAAETGLNNITTEHVRLEDHYKRYDFVVSRAVASLDEMVQWVWKNVKAVGFNDLPNGILYLKGGMEAGNGEAWGTMGAGKTTNLPIIRLPAERLFRRAVLPYQIHHSPFLSPDVADMIIYYLRLSIKLKTN